MNVVFLGSKSTRDKVIYFMISFAVGGLLGDVFFHTLPHLNEGSHSHGHDHHHDHEHTHEHNHGGHGHSHDPA
jgi:ABC-type nickel/cobalt efflux system permease component RcnA